MVLNNTEAWKISQRTSFQEFWGSVAALQAWNLLSVN
jgi:hypothetical protein